MATNHTFKLGQRLKDQVTGFVGIATCEITTLAGTVQMILQPAIPSGGENVMPADMSFDWQRLDKVDEGVAPNYADTVFASDSFTLGEELKDMASGFRGIAMMRARYLNGCVKYQLVSKQTSKGTSFDQAAHEMFVDVALLTYIDKGIVSKVTPKPPGGPALKRPLGRLFVPR